MHSESWYGGVVRKCSALGVQSTCISLWENTLEVTAESLAAFGPPFCLCVLARHLQLTCACGSGPQTHHRVDGEVPCHQWPQGPVTSPGPRQICTEAL